MADDVEVKISEEGGGSNRLIAAVESLANSAEKLDGSTNKLIATTKQLGDTNRKTAGDVDVLKGKIAGAESAFSSLKAMAAGAFAALSAGKIIEYADGYTKVRNSLTLVTKTQGETNKATEEAFSIAKRTSSSVDSTARTYANFTRTLQQNNQDTSQAGKLTEILNKAVNLTGPSAEAASSGIMQFGQALGKGALNGDELTAILENTPGLALALAEGLRVPVGALKEMGAAGQLTGTKLTEALTSAGDAVNKAYDQLPKTIGSAFTNLQTSLIQYVGTANNASGASNLLIKGINGVANNLNILIPALAAVAGAIGLIGFVKLTASLISAGAAFVTLAGQAGMAAIAMGTTFAVPLLAIGAAVLGIIGLLKLFGVSFDEAGIAVLNFVAKLIGAKEAAAGTGDGTSKAAAALDKLAASGKNADGSFNPFIGTLKATAANTNQAKAGVDAVTVSVTKAGQGFGQVRVAAEGAATGFTEVNNSSTAAMGGFRNVQTASSGASTGIQEFNMNLNRVAPAATGASTATATAATAARDHAAAVQQSTAQINAQTQANLIGAPANNTSTMATANATIAETQRVGILTQLLNILTQLFNYSIYDTQAKTTATAATAASTAANTADAAAKNSNATSTGLLAKVQDALNASLGMTAGAAGASKSATDASKASTDAHTTASNSAKDAVEAHKQKMQEFAAAAAQAQQASQQTAQSFMQIATSAASSEARVDALSRALRENYSSAASNAAAAAATLADNLYGSGSAASMAASQYDEAAAAADRYASSASNASSASRNIFADYSSGGTPGGSFPYIEETFQPTYKGENVGKATTVVRGGPQSVVDSANTLQNFDKMKELYRRANEIGNKYGFLSVGEALQLAGSADKYANFERIQKNNKVAADQGRLYGPNSKPITYQQYNELYRNEYAGISAFAQGGGMKVGGNGGTDSQFVSFWATPNETVSVRTPAQMKRDNDANDNGRQEPQQQGPVVIKAMNIVTKDADSFRRTRTQTARDIGKSLARATRR